MELLRGVLREGLVAARVKCLTKIAEMNGRVIFQSWLRERQPCELSEVDLSGMCVLLILNDESQSPQAKILTELSRQIPQTQVYVVVESGAPVNTYISSSTLCCSFENLADALRHIERRDHHMVIVLDNSYVDISSAKRMIQHLLYDASIAYSDGLITGKTSHADDVLLTPGVLYSRHCAVLDSVRCYGFGAKNFPTEQEIESCGGTFRSLFDFLIAANGGYATRMNGFSIATQSLPAGRSDCGVGRLPADIKMISIVIPTRDRWDLLGTCLASIQNSTSSVSIEIVVVDNGSSDATFLRQLALWEGQSDLNRVIRSNTPFNWSRLNNEGVRLARGDVLLFLNNDTELLSQDGIYRLAQRALIQNVGVVGALLLYPDNTIQHAGVVLGYGGAADHPYRGAKQPVAFSPFVDPNVSRPVSAVTGAALAVRRELFDLVGGFDEAYEVTGSDVAFCLDCNSAGYATEYFPEVVFVHHESKTRKKMNLSCDNQRLAERMDRDNLLPDIHYHSALSLQSLYPLVLEGPQKRFAL